MLLELLKGTSTSFALRLSQGTRAPALHDILGFCWNGGAWFFGTMVTGFVLNDVSLSAFVYTAGPGDVDGKTVTVGNSCFLRRKLAC